MLGLLTCVKRRVEGGFTHKSAVSTQWSLWKWRVNAMQRCIGNAFGCNGDAFPYYCIPLLMLPFNMCHILSVSLSLPPSLSPMCLYPSLEVLSLKPTRVCLMNSIHQSPIPLIRADPQCHALLRTPPRLELRSLPTSDRGHKSSRSNGNTGSLDTSH